MRTKNVQPSYYELADFNEYDCIRTDDLLRCLAVIAYSGENQLGGIAHLTVFNKPTDYMAWLKQHFDPSRTLIHLVGGADDSSAVKRNSSDLVREIEELMGQAHYSIQSRDLYGIRTRNCILEKNGRIVVEYAN